MKNQVFLSLILTPVMFLLASTSAMLLPGYPPLTPLKKGGDSGINLLLDRESKNAIAHIAHIETQELVANEDSSENECDDDELVDCGQV
jgi:hypothetical protein